MAASVAVVVGTLAAIPIALPSGYGLLWVASYASVGGLLVIRRPRNPIGWILMTIGLLTAEPLGAYGSSALSRDLPGGALAIVLHGVMWVPQS